MSTKRQQITDALETLLKTISAFKTVSAWRFLPDEQEDLPAVVFEDKQSNAVSMAGGTVQHTLTVDIDFQAVGDSSIASVRSLAENILTTFGTDPLLGDLLTGSRQVGFDMGINTANARLAMGRLTLALEYETGRFEI